MTAPNTQEPTEPSTSAWSKERTEAVAMNRQDSLHDQMVTVLTWARESGCYDAYDWIADRFAISAPTDKGERCPTHGIPDCSPLLNGCSWRPSAGGEKKPGRRTCICGRVEERAIFHTRECESMASSGENPSIGHGCKDHGPENVGPCCDALQCCGTKPLSKEEKGDEDV